MNQNDSITHGKNDESLDSNRKNSLKFITLFLKNAVVIPILEWYYTLIILFLIFLLYISIVEVIEEGKLSTIIAVILGIGFLVVVFMFYIYMVYNFTKEECENLKTLNRD